MNARYLQRFNFNHCLIGKLFMKTVIILISLMALITGSCKKINSECNTALLDGKWRMIAVKEITSGLLTTKPSSISGDVDITFTSLNAVNGILTGKTPTNEIGQNSYSTGPNRTITIPALAMTKVMETSWGEEFVDNIRNSQQYSFDNSGRLNINTTNKTLIFQKL